MFYVLAGERLGGDDKQQRSALVSLVIYDERP